MSVDSRTHTLQEAGANEKRPHGEDVEKQPTEEQLVREARKASNASVAAAAVLKHSHDADEALKAFMGHEGEVIHIDEETNKRLLRTIDWNLMPLMCVVYGMNFLDKTTLSYASVTGIKKDINLKGNDYQWLGSMFYFGAYDHKHTVSQH